MHPMIRTLTFMLAGTVLPSLAHAQEAPKAGVVTNLQGTASVVRAATPQGQPLKFRDDVFLRDNITAGEKSLARILLGGKAVVTVREHSSVTITEVPGTAIVEMSRGAIAVAVSRNRLQPGESVQIKTPNAIAGIRGTVLVAEVTQTSAQSDPVTAFSMLRGLADVQQLDNQGRPFGAVIPLSGLQRVSMTGMRPPGAPQALSPAAAQALAADFQVQIKEAPPAANAAMVNNQLNEAIGIGRTVTPPAPNPLLIKPPTTDTPSIIKVPPDTVRTHTSAPLQSLVPPCVPVPGTPRC